MVTKVEDKYACSICNKLHSRDIYAIKCEQSHDIVYVPIPRGDLFKLVQFLYSGDSELLSKEIITLLLKYSKYSKGQV